MNKVATAVAAVVAVAWLVFLVALAGTLVGIASGFVVGLFFEATILDVMARMGINTAGLSLWQVGGALGFIGAFFRSTASSSKS